MPGQTLISFEGLTEQAAEKLAKGLAESSRMQLNEILSRSDEISKMRQEDVEKLRALIGASRADGNCGWGCGN